MAGSVSSAAPLFYEPSLGIILFLNSPSPHFFLYSGIVFFGIRTSSLSHVVLWPVPIRSPVPYSLCPRRGLLCMTFSRKFGVRPPPYLPESSSNPSRNCDEHFDLLENVSDLPLPYPEYLLFFVFFGIPDFPSWAILFDPLQTPFRPLSCGKARLVA